MAGLAIHLLGPPAVSAGGRAVAPPRGRKAWALLALLLAEERPVPRERVAGLLFADADDPLGALRWNLSELRRVLGDAGALRGPRLALDLPPATLVDVRVVLSGSWAEAVALPGLGRDLLEGMDFPSSPSFDAWLTNERRHLQAGCEAVLREAAAARLAAGAPGDAIDHATRLVALDPFDERAHALLISAYAATGDAGGARRRLEACRDLFRRELGRSPGPAVIAAAGPPAAAAPPRSSAVSDRSGALALLEAGAAALRAGAVDTAIDCLGRAAAQAAAASDPALLAEAELALALARFDTGRAGGDVVAIGLRRALAQAQRAGTAELGARARLALAYVEELAGRYERAERWLTEADAGLPEGRLGGDIAMARGRCRMDRGHYAQAAAVLEAVLAGACARGERELEIWTRSHLGRNALLRGDAGAAIVLLEDAAACARATGMTSYVPMPLGFLGAALAQRGDLDGARERLERGLALAEQVDDTCWQAINLTGLGRLDAAAGDLPGALAMLEDARRRVVRGPTVWSWLLAHVTDALCEIAVAAGAPSARRWVTDLETHAARTGMRDLLARAHLHRHALGEESALAAAALVAADVESPALSRAIAERAAVAA